MEAQQRRQPVGNALQSAVAGEGDGGPLQRLRLRGARLVRRHVQVVAVRPHVLRPHRAPPHVTFATGPGFASGLVRQLEKFRSSGVPKIFSLLDLPDVAIPGLASRISHDPHTFYRSRLNREILENSMGCEHQWSSAAYMAAMRCQREIAFPSQWHGQASRESQCGHDRGTHFRGGLAALKRDIIGCRHSLMRLHKGRNLTPKAAERLCYFNTHPAQPPCSLSLANALVDRALECSNCTNNAFR